MNLPRLFLVLIFISAVCSYSLAQPAKSPRINLSLDVPGLFRQVRMAAEMSDGEHFAAGVTASCYHPLGLFPGARAEVFARIYLASSQTAHPYRMQSGAGPYFQGFFGITTHRLQAKTYPEASGFTRASYKSTGMGGGIGWQHFFTKRQHLGLDFYLGMQNYGELPAAYYQENGENLNRRWQPLGPGARVVPRLSLVYCVSR